MTPDIILVSMEEAEAIFRIGQIEVHHVCSLGRFEGDPPIGYEELKANKLRLEFDDIEPVSLLRYEACTPQDIRQLIRWAETVAEGTALFHCAAGISRSSAAVLITLGVLLGAGREDEAVALLAEIPFRTQARGLRDNDFIRPNRRMLWLADQALGTDLRGACRKQYPDTLYQREYLP